MPTRKTILAPDEYYHIYNRGSTKREIFREQKDYARLLFVLCYLQAPTVNVTNHGRYSSVLLHAVNKNVKHPMFNKKPARDIIAQRAVDLVCFALMPNHFHLLVREKEEGGISRYMQRVLNGYTKYWNTKYAQSGHLFEGPFQAVHVEDDHQLRYLSAYIHRNPHEIDEWHGRAWEYPWSSYRDFVAENRWGGLLQNDIVRGQFDDGEDYKKFVETSGAKDADGDVVLDEGVLIDFGEEAKIFESA